MAVRGSTGILLLVLLCCSSISIALYEDQVGIADWHQKHIGKVKHAVFHTQKAGRKRVVVSTEENVIASLDLRRGDIYWRHSLGRSDIVDDIDIALGKYVVSLSSQGSVIRAWNLPDGLMIWESVLQASKPSRSLLFVPASIKTEKDNVILVYSGEQLHAVSSIDGEVVWQTEIPHASFVVQQIFQSLNDDNIYVVGFVGFSNFHVYKINGKSGEVLEQSSEIFSSGFSNEALLVSSDLLVALDAARSTLVLVSFRDKYVSFHETRISDLIEGFSGSAVLLPQKLPGLFVLETDSCALLVKVRGENDLEVIDKFSLLSAVSNAVSLTGEQQAFAIVQHADSKIQLTIKPVNDLRTEFLKETISIGSNRGHVQKVFINNYVRTDRSHGFRALIIMEDHSLLLLQQGEVVWSREDGLASILDSTVSELPVEKDGVSVAKVEENLLEWLKGHMLKLKGTLMLASADDLVAIQDLRLKGFGRNKMTRDHNGFRKLIIVLTKSGKVYALHTGDGHIVWSHLLSASHYSKSCQKLIPLSIYQWSVPHHHAMHENPSVLVVGRCGFDSDALGVLSVINSYTGKELNSFNLDHSIAQIVPLPLMDSTERRIHLIIDEKSSAHLYPKTSDAKKVFYRERSNIYWYSVDAENAVIKGYIVGDECGISDEYCFNMKELWSIIFPSEYEKIAAAVTRKMNEVVHTQAKIIGDQDVMYKYISKNLLFVATVSPKAAAGIGSTIPEEAWLIAYLIDAVTGRILHRVTHHGAQGPIKAVVSENWVVYHYFNLRAHRYEMSVMEIYDQSRADNKDVWKLVLGKHNLTKPVSSYSWPEVVVRSQSYFFAHSVKAISVTSTAKGITSKQLLVGTISDQVLALDKRYLDPRRTAKPSQSESEEGIIPLTDSLPIIPQSYITHSLQVEGLRGIVTIPSKLESTTLVFLYGLDLFFTRIAPSRTYDSLTEDFNYALLLITIVALIVAILVTWAWSEKKELREKWR